MSENIENVIKQFFLSSLDDENHRYKSWEHCYCYFSQDIDRINKNIACLHLSFYLASWGMYRGSSFLLWKDYLIHYKIVEKILEYKHLQKINFDEINKNSKNLKDIFELSKFIREWYPNNIKKINERKSKINVTDTLLTKILLGTLGCVPAYDRFFLDGLHIKKIEPYNFSEKNFLSIVEFYKKNKTSFFNIQRIIKNEVGIKYPIMKLVDMYFFTLGYIKSQYVDNEEMKEILEDENLIKSIKQDISEAKNGGYEIV